MRYDKCLLLIWRSSCNLKTMKLLDRALIGVCMVIRPYTENTTGIALGCNTLAPMVYGSSIPSQLSMKFVLLINLKLLSIAKSFLLNIAEHENFSANKYENANFVSIFLFISREKFMLS